MELWRVFSNITIQNEAEQRLTEFCQQNALVTANTLFQQHKRWLYTRTSLDGQYWIRLIIFFAAKDGEALYSEKKQDWGLIVVQIINPYCPKWSHSVLSNIVEVTNRFKGLDLIDRVPEGKRQHYRSSVKLVPYWEDRWLVWLSHRPFSSGCWGAWLTSRRGRMRAPSRSECCGVSCSSLPACASTSPACRRQKAISDSGRKPVETSGLFFLSN